MILSKFGTNLTMRSTASTDACLSKPPGSTDLGANLSSGGLSPLSPYSHGESLIQWGSTVRPCMEEWLNRQQI